jgi:hypothetical protein
MAAMRGKDTISAGRRLQGSLRIYLKCHVRNRL